VIGRCRHVLFSPNAIDHQLPAGRAGSGYCIVGAAPLAIIAALKSVFSFALPLRHQVEFA
jgi:hypothetical protein